MSIPILIELDDRELATVLAALLLYQAADIDDESEVNDIATDYGAMDALTVAEIGDLCERLNTGEVS